MTEHYDDGSTMNVPQHGIPGYSRTTTHERPRRSEPVPLDRLESTQPAISRNHVRNMARRKGDAPPIEVTHWVNEDRYVVEEGNHRAMVAIKRGQTHAPAYVTRATTWTPPEKSGKS